MNREAFKNAIYKGLTEKGYQDVKISNGQPYNARDIYFCPQAPELFMLTILPGRTEIRKVGKNGFRANLSTKVNGPEDIDSLHEEINNVIYKSDETTLANKNTGCLASLLLLIPILYYLIH